MKYEEFWGIDFLKPGKFNSINAKFIVDFIAQDNIVATVKGYLRDLTSLKHVNFFKEMNVA